MTEAISPSEISDVENYLVEIFNVTEDEVTVDTSYKGTGTIDIDIPDDMGEEEAESFIEEAIADALGLHVSEVEIHIDPESGEITYVTFFFA